MSKKAILFDVDGTLIDSNDFHAHAWVQALSDFGYVVSFDEVKPLIGMGGDKLMPKLIRIESESPKGQKIGKRRWDLFKRHYLDKVGPMDGARELIAELKERRYSLAIATSGKKEELDLLLDAAGLNGLIDLITTSDDAEASKPDPEIVLAALFKLGVPKNQAVMVGDTPYDIEAANRAGLECVCMSMVPTLLMTWPLAASRNTGTRTP